MEIDSPEIMSSNDSLNAGDSNDFENYQNTSHVIKNSVSKLQQQVIANFQKKNIPNVNVPERIIICLDVCNDDNNSLYRLGDGTTFTPINMMKRILDFFLHSKQAINKRTEFALMVIKDAEAYWIQNFTNNLKDILIAIDYVDPEECTTDTFDFKQVFQILKEKVEIPECKGDCIMPPPFVVRMLVLYGRSNCIPIVQQDDPYLIFLKKQLYFCIDILLAHDEECALNRCIEIYDALQNLDNGYSYVYEVSRNAAKIHDCIAKLLAHPLQRPHQKIANYTFGVRQ